MRSDADVAIDIVERLPTPFGLIRAGVAPDHEKTRNVSRSYAATAAEDAVRFFGNVEVGKDVTIAELQEMYDAVVLAVGAPKDRKLGIPGEDKGNVFGSADFVGWYNGHPDFRNLDPDLNIDAVAVIGVGNVAIDIARILVRTGGRLDQTDIADHAKAAVTSASITDVYLFGRRGPVEAKFTNVELREMGALTLADPVVDADQIPAEVTGDWSDRDRRLRERNLATLREFAARPRGQKPKQVHFVFCAAPVEILGGDTVTGLRLERTRVESGRAVGTGETFDVSCGLVIPAIGYASHPIPGVPFNADRGRIECQDGRVAPGLYAVGWAKRGPTGVIGTNKPDGKQAAAQILEDIAAGSKPGRDALEAALAAKGVRWVSWEDWQKIDAAEQRAAQDGSPRRKFTTIAEMISILD